MKSQYGISAEELIRLRQRDTHCVYCGVFMTDRVGRGKQKHYATIEHIYPPGDDTTWVSWCCNSCNASHKKPLREWFKTKYCIDRNINENTVAPIIKDFLASGLKEADQLWLDGTEDRFLKYVAVWGDEQRISRSALSASDAKSFDRVVKAISYRRYTFDFRGMAPGTFGRYYGFMYWIEGDTLNRAPFSD